MEPVNVVPVENIVSNPTPSNPPLSDPTQNSPSVIQPSEKSELKQSVSPESKKNPPVIPSLAPSKLSKPKKDTEKQAETYKLRNDFNNSLAKLRSKETKNVGINECHKFIDSNITPNGLRIFISSISNVDNKVLNQTAKEGQLEILAYVITSFKEKLLDPLDNPPNLLKTMARITGLINKYLKENSQQIHENCSDVLLKLYESCMYKENIDITETILYAPLEALIFSEPNKFAQAGASKCLYKLFEKFKSEENIKLLEKIGPKFVNLFIVFFYFLLKK